MYHAVLHCTVRYFTALHLTVLYCTVLCFLCCAVAASAKTRATSLAANKCKLAIGGKPSNVGQNLAGYVRAPKAVSGTFAVNLWVRSGRGIHVQRVWEGEFGVPLGGLGGVRHLHAGEGPTQRGVHPFFKHV